MKRKMIKIVGGVAACFIAFGTAHAQKKDPFVAKAPEVQNGPIFKVIRVKVDLFEVKTEDIPGLMKLVGKSIDNSKLAEELQKRAKDKKIKNLDSVSIISRPGERALSSAVNEYTYPTDYEDRQNITRKDGVKEQIGAGLLPTLFETRPIGTILEVESNIGGGEEDNTVSTSLNIESSYKFAEQVWLSVNKENGKEEVKTPNIYSLKAKLGASLIGGKPTLISTVSPHNEAGDKDPTRKVLILVTATVLSNKQ